jgi:hypothetical protein
MGSLRTWLVPELRWRELPKVATWMGLGALAAGIYGIAHDQVTYSLGPEYFTRLKFEQFAYAAPLSGSERQFAGAIGFLATWWVGALVMWIFARVSLKREGSLPPAREMAIALGIVFAASIAGATGGWLWGIGRRATGYAEGWIDRMDSLGVEDAVSFMSVAYIHNASYLGGALGTMAALVYLSFRRRRRNRCGSIEEALAKTDPKRP